MEAGPRGEGEPVLSQEHGRGGRTVCMKTDKPEGDGHGRGRAAFR